MQFKKLRLLLAVFLLLSLGAVIFFKKNIAAQEMDTQTNNAAAETTTEETEEDEDDDEDEEDQRELTTGRMTTVRTTSIDRARTCVGDCPSEASLDCWPTTGNISVQPFGAFKTHQNADAYDIANRGVWNGEAIGIYAPANGMVSYSWNESGTGCMAKLKLDSSSEHGGYYLLFMHMPRICCEADGCGNGGNQTRTVSVGDQLGIMGNTGFSTGPHLHYEISANGYSNAAKYSKANSILQAKLQGNVGDHVTQTCR